MMVDSNDSNVTAVDHVSTPAMLGTTLAMVREERNLTVEDIANRLRLSLRQVIALENDDFSVLPEAMITRGFIRNYARCWRLTPNHC